jgi:tetratricopeptide (TPR) repeat protein
LVVVTCFNPSGAQGLPAPRGAKDARLHHTLGKAHLKNMVVGQVKPQNASLERAIKEFKETIHLSPGNPEAHFDLGGALVLGGELDAAIAAYREAFKIKKDYAEAHCYLGNALVNKGQFEEALKHFEEGHKLGSRNKGWRYPSGQWLKECERFLDLDKRLSEVLSGRDKPTDAA